MSDGASRRPGEWLLDGAWTEDVLGDERVQTEFPVRLRCSLECESSTAASAYFIDFSKLLVVSSDIKIFAAGLNHKTAAGAEEYIRNRVCQTNRLMAQSVCDGGNLADWYLAFWPSPLKIDGKSLWHHLDCGKFNHLSRITSFHCVDGTFRKVECDSEN